MSSTPLPALVALIISAYILSAAFGRSRAEEQLAGAPPKSDSNEAMNSGGGGGGGNTLKQKLGEQMKGELLADKKKGGGWVPTVHGPNLSHMERDAILLIPPTDIRKFLGQRYLCNM